MTAQGQSSVPVFTLCPDGTVPVVVCDDCKALVLARDLEEHAHLAHGVQARRE